MKIHTKPYLLFLISFCCLFLISCQHETGTTTNTNQKPKLGTRWVYRYSTYNSQGNFQNSMNVVYKAISEDMLGGELWLKVIDSATNTTIFYIKEKTGGLFQYIGNGPNLMCKYPALVNDTYRSLFNTTDSADYFVRAVNDTLQLGVIPDVVVNYYEGIIGGQTVDKLWYSSKMWIAQRYLYRKPPLLPYYRYATLILQDFTY